LAPFEIELGKPSEKSEGFSDFDTKLTQHAFSQCLPTPSSTALSGLLVAVSDLFIAVSVFVLMVRLGKALDDFSDK
jgi:hypothetical protein